MRYYCILAISLFMLITACVGHLVAAAPVQPVWTGAGPLQTVTIKDFNGNDQTRYFCDLTVGGVIIQMYYVEASTVTVGNPFPMGATAHYPGSRYTELHSPGDVFPNANAPANQGYHVYFTKNFWASKTEVGMNLWNEVMTAAPVSWPTPAAYVYDNTKEDPVFVSAVDAELFNATLSASLGVSAELPSEAEWEYMARGYDPSAPWPQIWASPFSLVSNYYASATGNSYPIPTEFKDGSGRHLYYEFESVMKKFRAMDMSGGVYRPNHVGRDGPWDVIQDHFAVDVWEKFALNDDNHFAEISWRSHKLIPYVFDMRHFPDAAVPEFIPPTAAGQLPTLRGTGLTSIDTDNDGVADSSAFGWLRVKNVLAATTGAHAGTVVNEVGLLKIDKETWSFDASIEPRNSFGFHHLLGNVAEWTKDMWDKRLPYCTASAPTAAKHSSVYGNKTSPADGHVNNTEGTLRVLRGGSWRDTGKRCVPSARNAMDPNLADTYTGFRFVIYE